MSAEEQEHPMSAPGAKSVSYATVELDSVRYAVIRESLLVELCRRARIAAKARAQADPRAGEPSFTPLDARELAARLIQRRNRSGLTQAELARRAGIRTETLNRIERGRTTPDFSTIRKLVLAMNAAEAAQAASTVRRAVSAKGVHA